MLQRVFHKRGKGCGEPSEGRCAVSKEEGIRQEEGRHVSSLAQVLRGRAKKRSHPMIGTRASVPLRGATQFRSDRAAPSCPRVAAGEAAPVSRPAGSAVFGRVHLRKALSTLGQMPAGPLSVRRNSGYFCAVVAVNAVILPYFSPKVKELWKNYRAKGTRLGFMPMRQSRSPRARPWMSISAVATLVAMGTEC